MATPPNVNNNYVGKGELYFDRWTAANVATGERHLGNATAFSVTPAIDVLEHFSSMGGIKDKDNSVDVTKSLSVKFTLDEYEINNLSLALYGDGVGTLSQGDGNIGGLTLVLYHDRWVQVTDLQGNEIRNLSVSSVGVAGYTEGTDFSVDSDVGRIKALSTGSIADGESCTISYTFGAATWDNITIFGRTPVLGKLRFVGQNTVGDKFEVALWKVKLSMNSDLNYISDDWATIEFSGEALNDKANHPTQPFGRVLGPKTDISGS